MVMTVGESTVPANTQPRLAGQGDFNTDPQEESVRSERRKKVIRWTKTVGLGFLVLCASPALRHAYESGSNPDCRLTIGAKAVNISAFRGAIYTTYDIPNPGIVSVATPDKNGVLQPARDYTYILTGAVLESHDVVTMSDIPTARCIELGVQYGPAGTINAAQPGSAGDAWKHPLPILENLFTLN